jgi:hypothetical protein
MASLGQGVRPYLRSLAGWNWNRQNEALKLGLSLQEETLTEMLLLQIARDCAPLGLKVRMFTRAQEHANGADWEWTFKSTHCTIALRVQAKRLYMSGPNAGRYGGWKHLGTQATKLIADAGTDYFPIFVFYNNYASQVFSRKPSHGFHGPSQWGCAFANAQDIEKSLSNWPEDIVDKMHPWHELFDLCTVAGRRNRLPGEERGPEAEKSSAVSVRNPLWLEPYGDQQGVEEYLEERGLAGVAYFDASEADVNWSSE